MRLHRFASHTPDEMRRLSDLGHKLEGLMLGIVGVLGLLSGSRQTGGAASAWPVVALSAGVSLLGLLYPRHPPEDWPVIWEDPQQRQHTLLAMAALLGGGAEVVRTRTQPRGGSGPAQVWPAALVFIGGLFLVHSQHGRGPAVAEAVRRHRLLGATLVLAGLLRALQVSSGSSIFARLWSLAVLGAAAQLVAYHEPEGAYEQDGSHIGHE